MWDVQHMGCLGCGLLGMRDIWEVECLGCGMFRIWDIQNAR